MLFLDANKIFSIVYTYDLGLDEKVSCIEWDPIPLMLTIKPPISSGYIRCHFIDLRPLRQAMQGSHTPSDKSIIDRHFQK